MTYVVMILVLAFGLIAQTFAPSTMLFGKAAAPFLLSVVVYYALNRSMGVMLISALFAGFLQDAMSPVPLGYSAFCFCAIGVVIASSSEFVMTESVITQAFFGFISCVIVTLALYVLLSSNGYISVGALAVVWKMIGSGMQGLICVPVTFFAVHSLDSIVGNIEIKEEIPGVIE